MSSGHPRGLSFWVLLAPASRITPTCRALLAPLSPKAPGAEVLNGSREQPESPSLSETPLSEHGLCPSRSTGSRGSTSTRDPGSFCGAASRAHTRRIPHHARRARRRPTSLWPWHAGPAGTVTCLLPAAQGSGKASVWPLWFL